MSLVAGIGCRRGVSAAEIEHAVRQALGTLDFSALSAVASIDVKQNEAGLREFCERHRLALHFFSADEIASVPGAISTHALEHLNVNGVCEPCAMLLSGAMAIETLVVPKTIAGGVTVAIARKAS
ncbi:cobalamin biosynthesis protein [Caballeronia sp. BR00000012568055]|uniref:cobalamin biosynthesis protein n=1 Tax=Caballeronia sp. BR00000012568055 TaxID=2918761 RepID=UPI0023F8E7AE|nr:cobalamin biosynthesis protein [Caballeronia sp. BR00000012568055]